MRALFAAFVAGSLALLAPQVVLASAPALQPGVHVDPGSPAGKEYQIPVAGARSEAAGGGQAAWENPPLFGVGVAPAAAAPDSTPTGTAPPGSQSRAAAPGASPGAHGHTRSRPRPVAASSPAGSSPASAAGPPAGSVGGAGGAGGNGWIPLVGGGLLVLVLGGGGGLAIRQRALRG